MDESTACLTKTLLCLLPTKPENIDALLADPRGKSGKVAVRGYKTKAVETATVQQVHGVNDKSDIGSVLARRVRELALVKSP